MYQKSPSAENMGPPPLRNSPFFNDNIFKILDKIKIRRIMDKSHCTTQIGTLGKEAAANIKNRRDPRPHTPPENKFVLLKNFEQSIIPKT